MPKAEPGTPKWLANKMKAKGLQKLKWYCQMCEKQCRDENGFKCHRLSEAHQRQMQIFCQDANRFMDEYSSMFEKEFMRLMKTRFCRTRVLANTVYTQLISDKTHIHMNATVWITLTDFVLYLGNTGKCKIEQTSKGWYIEYIDREKIEREKQFLERKKVEYSYEQLKEKKINDAIEEAKKTGKYIEPKFTGIEKKVDQKIVISSLKAGNKSTTGISIEGKTKTIKPSFNVLLKQSAKKVEEKKQRKETITNQPPTQNNQEIMHFQNKPLSALELIILENEQKKRMKKKLTQDTLNKNSEEYFKDQNKKNNLTSVETLEGNKKKKQKVDAEEGRDKHHNTHESDMENVTSNNVSSTEDVWICENIAVRIIDKKHKYYKKKGIIIYMSKNNKKKCKIKMKNKEICQVYQEQLQTVIPKIGGTVRILKGRHKGYKARVVGILLEEEMAEVVIEESNSDLSKHSNIKRFLYDDLSKLVDE